MSARWSASRADQARHDHPDRSALRLFHPERAANSGDSEKPRQVRRRACAPLDLSDVPVEIGLQGEDGYPHQGPHGLRRAAGRFRHRHAERARPVRQQGRRAAAGSVRPGAHADRPAGQGAPDVRNDAIGTSQEGSYVLVVGADNVVERKVVTTGMRDGQLRVIERARARPTGW